MFRAKDKQGKEARDAVDAARASKNWDAAIAASKRYLKFESASVLQTIVLVEKFLEENNLSEAKSTLETIISTPSVPEFQEAVILFGFLEKRLDNNAKALEHFNTIDQYISQDVSVVALGTLYQIKLVTNALQYKAEILSAQGENTKTLIEIHLKVFDIAQKFFQKNPSKPDQATQTAIEESIFNIPKLYVQLGDHEEAVKWMRRGLTSFAPSRLQKTRLLQLLASCLLFEPTIDKFYKPPVDASSSSSSSAPSGYVPRNATEEAIVASLLFEQETGSSLDDESALIYDFMIHAYCSRFAHKFTPEVMERSLTFRPDDAHLWQQFALSLVSAGHHKKALIVIQKAIDICSQTNRPLLQLLACKICLFQLSDVKLAIRYAKDTVNLCQNVKISSSSAFTSHFLPRAYHLLGISYSIKALTTPSFKSQQEYHENAKDAFVHAIKLGCLDYKLFFHAAMEHAECREINKALELLQQAFDLNPSFVEGWQLLVLLLTSKKQTQEAVNCCQIALSQFPNDLPLLYLATKITLEDNRPIEALQILQKACEVCKSLADQQLDADDLSSSESTTEPAGRANRSFSVAALDDIFGDADGILSPRMSAASVSQKTNTYDKSHTDLSAGTKTYNTLEEEAETNNSPLLHFGPLALWNFASEIFLRLGKLHDALECIKEAKKISPIASQVFYNESKIYEAQGNIEEAIKGYNKAIQLDSWNVDSTLELARIYFQSKQIVSVEDFLNSAVRKRPTSHQAWYQYGLLLQEKGDHEQASECFLTSISLEETAPIIPFYYISRNL